MARDSNPATNKSTGGAGGKSRGMPPMLLGIVIGLLLGVMMALGVAVWLNRANNPFVEKSRPVEALPTIAARPAPSLPAKNEKNEPDKPRFEFYQILPGDKGSAERSAPGTSQAKSQPAHEPKVAAKADPVAVKEAPKTTSVETVYLQAGAFQSATDAENLKAKIAFSGFEASVRPVNLPDKGTLYRVRLGPYKNADEVNRIKVALSQNGIGAAVVKAGD